MFPPDLRDEAARLLEAFRARKRRIATAESCTGGLIAGCSPRSPAPPTCVERGFVTYSNDAKSECLGVPADLIAMHGAVSEAVARAMAEGALAHRHADTAVAVTGVAGPEGGTAAKPVGPRAPGGRRARAPPLCIGNAASAISAARPSV